MSEIKADYKVTRAPFPMREKGKHKTLIEEGWKYHGKGAEYYQSPSDKNYYAPQMAWYLFCQMELDEVS